MAVAEKMEKVDNSSCPQTVPHYKKLGAEELQ
jgi:hypothetical protein